MLVSLAPSGIGQQPFQVPTALGASSGLPIETVGTRMLVRRNVTGGSELGFLNGVTSAAFNLTFNVTEAAKVFGVHFERGVTTPANVYISYLPTGSTLRQLRRVPLAGGSPVTLATMPAGQWQLEAVNANNTAFFFLDRASTPNRIGRVVGSTFTVISSGTTPSQIDRLTLSPNGQTLVMELPTVSPFTPHGIVRMSTAGGASTAIVSTTLVRTQVVWLDNRFLGCIAQSGTVSQLIRLDTLGLDAVTPLTLPGINAQPQNGVAVSDDLQWLTFVAGQNITDASGTGQEVTVMAMRIANATSADPGGGFIVLGDYRGGATPPASLTTWQLIDLPQIQSFTIGATPTVRVIWSGRHQFTDPIQLFRCDVIDEVEVSPRAVPGVTVQVSTVPAPQSVFWGVHVSLERTSAPIAIPGIGNAVLIQNAVALFSSLATPGVPLSVAVPITSPALSGNRLFFQGVWLDAASQLFLSTVTELPIF